MKLGNKAFASNGAVDSEIFLPDGLYTTLVARPTEDGTVELFLIDKYSGEALSQGTPVAGLADEDNVAVVTYPLAGAYAGAFLRYENTSAAPGTCAFSAGTEG